MLPLHKVTGKTTEILLIDDDASLSGMLIEYATPEGFTVTAALSGEEGLQCLKSMHYALVILDVMLPGIDGLEVLRRILHMSNVPVMFLTTRGSTADRVRGLHGGADDYLPKPFAPEELLERIRSILRRVQPRRGKLGFLRVEDVELDAAGRWVRCGDKQLELTGSEFTLLHLLLSNAGTVLAREELVNLVLARELSANDRSIDSLVSNLRRKLGPARAGGERILSMRGIGYLYVIADRETAP